MQCLKLFSFHFIFRKINKSKGKKPTIICNMDCFNFSTSNFFGGNLRFLIQSFVILNSENQNHEKTRIRNSIDRFYGVFK